MNNVDNAIAAIVALNLTPAELTELASRITPKAVRTPRAKLTADTVKQIRLKYESGAAAQSDLVRMYNVDPATIHRIVTYKTWRGTK